MLAQARTSATTDATTNGRLLSSSISGRGSLPPHGVRIPVLGTAGNGRTLTEGVRVNSCESWPSRPLRPAAFFCAVVPPWRALERLELRPVIRGRAQPGS